MGSGLEADLLAVVRAAIEGHERTQQIALGPSEIGDPCDRWIVYRLTGRKGVDQKSWKPTVGTAVHLWLEALFSKIERYETEATLDIDAAIRGHCDLYDRQTRTVVDYKIVGPKKLAKYRAEGLPQGYRVQAHSYGRGWVNRGEDVQYVAIWVLPRDGELEDAYWWEEPYNPVIPDWALNRYHVLAESVRAYGDDALELSTPVSHFCPWCEFYKKGSDDLTEGCPGVPWRRGY